jgi:hypothetical protein
MAAIGLKAVKNRFGPEPQNQYHTIQFGVQRLAEGTIQKGFSAQRKQLLGFSHPEGGSGGKEDSGRFFHPSRSLSPLS